MAFIYSASGEKVELVYSSDDLGVSTEGNEVATEAVKQVNAATKASRKAKATAPSSSRFDRIVLIRNAGSGASRNSFRTLNEAFSKSVTKRVKRALPVFIEPQSGLRLVATREITAKFKPGVKRQTIQKLLNDYDLEIHRTSEFDPHKRILVPKRDIDERLTLDLANSLSELTDDVSFANPNFIAEYRKGALPGDPLLKGQWHLENTGLKKGLKGEDVDAFCAWKITAGSPDVVIAIVDDGVDINHPDLKKNIWRNPDRKAKDKHGRNFYDDTVDPNPRYFNPPYDNVEVNDIHGTPCAGVAAATGNKSGGVGIAYNSKILPVKIFGADSLAPNDRVADAIRYAGLHAQIVSCSWHTAFNADLETAINDVALNGRGGKGTLVFCATGNAYDSSVYFPAKHKLAFAIGASNDQGIRCDYSNYGPGIDFVAPSGDPDRNRPGVITTDVSFKNRGFNLKGSYYDDFDGTSCATPLAAGVAALILSVNPSLSRDEVYDILVRSSDKIDKKEGKYKKGYSNQYGYGRVNACNAVTLAQSKLDKRQEIVLEAITFGVKGKPKTTAQLKKQLFGKDSKNWKLMKVENSKTSFDAFYVGKEALPAKEAWERVYQLRDTKNISYAEPSFLIPDPRATDQPQTNRRASFLSGSHDPATADNYEWNLCQANVQEAWKVTPPTGGKPFGEGIVIAHPDSGYRQHPELDKERVLDAKGYDFYNDDEIEEDLDGNHGLGTGSVIMSGGNHSNGQPFVTGAAPKAELVPFRVTTKRGIIPAPVLLCEGMVRLRKAINYIAQKKDCHVISMSLGGLPYEPVHEAIQAAVKEGIIVLAAAGNVVPFVVHPAAYEEVIALAACDINGKPWNLTASGSQVDATAPGHSVWRATITDSGEKTVERSSGTSFSVATTAGIAALWLAFHGRDTLIARYGKAGIAEAFRKVLVSTCQPSSALDPAKYGAGIVDAKKVLEASLPAAPGVKSVAKASLKQSLTKLDVLVQMFDGIKRETVKQGLGDLLKARGKKLDAVIEEVGDELAFQFFIDGDSYDAFRRSLEARSKGTKASGSSGVAKVRKTLAKQSVSQQLGSRL